MSDSELQALLGRLYVDLPLLRLFEIAPEEVVESYELSLDERDAILAVDREALRDFAFAIRYKRFKSFEGAFPSLFAISQRVRRHFNRFYELHTFTPSDTRREKNMRFVRFMVEAFAADPKLPPWASDLASFELGHFAISSLPRTVAEVEKMRAESSYGPLGLESCPRVRDDAEVVHVQYDVAPISKALHEGLDIESVLEEPDRSQPCSFVFVDRGPEAPKALKVSERTARLLDLCDSSTPVKRICQAFELRPSRELQRSVLEALRALKAQGVVGA